MENKVCLFKITSKPIVRYRYDPKTKRKSLLMHQDHQKRIIKEKRRMI